MTDSSSEPPPYPEFAARLQALRDKTGETQEDLAREIDVNVGAISAYERGLRMPHATTLVALAKHFAVSTDHLLLGEAMVDHHEYEAFHRFLATEYGKIAIRNGWIDLLRSMRLPFEPTVQTYRNIVLGLISSVEDVEAR